MLTVGEAGESLSGPPGQSLKVPAPSPAQGVTLNVAAMAMTATPVASRIPVTVSATLAANEALAARRRRGESVLPLAFGEAGLPVHPVLRAALAGASARNADGPVAERPCLREAAAGYWDRRGLPTDPADVICGPGSKPLIYGLLLALDADVAVAQPSWVSYASQAAMTGARAHFVPTPPGQGGVPDPALLDQAVTAARADGRRIGSVVVTLPDNPYRDAGVTSHRPGAVRGRRRARPGHHLGRDSTAIWCITRLPGSSSPAALAPERTVVTTALSKNLAVGGWRIGVARLPGAALRAAPSLDGLRERLLSIGSEILVRALRADPAGRCVRVRRTRLSWSSEWPAARACTPPWPWRWPRGSPPRGSPGPSRGPPSTCTRTSVRGGTGCTPGTG